MLKKVLIYQGWTALTITNITTIFKMSCDQKLIFSRCINEQNRIINLTLTGVHYIYAFVMLSRPLVFYNDLRFAGLFFAMRGFLCGKIIIPNIPTPHERSTSLNFLVMGAAIPSCSDYQVFLRGRSSWVTVYYSQPPPSGWFNLSCIHTYSL